MYIPEEGKEKSTCMDWRMISEQENMLVHPPESESHIYQLTLRDYVPCLFLENSCGSGEVVVTDGRGHRAYME